MRGMRWNVDDSVASEDASDDRSCGDHAAIGAVEEVQPGGAANAAVAARLGMRPRTVAHHLEHLYAKLAVSSRAGAVAAALAALDPG